MGKKETILRRLTMMMMIFLVSKQLIVRKVKGIVLFSHYLEILIPD